VKIIAPIFGNSCVTVRWSADATRLSYAGAHDFVVHVIDLSSGVDTVLPETVFAPGWHSWSPRGDAIAYENGRGGSRRIDIVDLATGRTRPLVGPGRFGTCEVWAPDWSPRGDEIAFTSCARKLYIVKADGTGLRTLATPAYAPRWSIDGGSLLFLTGNTLRRVRADGGGIQSLGRLPYVGPFSLGAVE
jgi:Tol biopolymer transport system component